MKISACPVPLWETRYPPGLEATPRTLVVQVVQQRFAILDDYVHEVKQRGLGAMIRVTTTDPKEARYDFTDVPEGRWLLVAEVTSRVSVLYWAVPIEVRAGEALAQNLYESNIWVEGLK